MSQFHLLDAFNDDEEFKLDTTMTSYNDEIDQTIKLETNFLNNISPTLVHKGYFLKNKILSTISESVDINFPVCNILAEDLQMNGLSIPFVVQHSMLAIENISCSTITKLFKDNEHIFIHSESSMQHIYGNCKCFKQLQLPMIIKNSNAVDIFTNNNSIFDDSVDDINLIMCKDSYTTNWKTSPVTQWVSSIQGNIIVRLKSSGNMNHDYTFTLKPMHVLIIPSNYNYKVQLQNKDIIMFGQYVCIYNIKDLLTAQDQSMMRDEFVKYYYYIIRNSDVVCISNIEIKNIVKIIFLNCCNKCINGTAQVLMNILLNNPVFCRNSKLLNQYIKCSNCSQSNETNWTKQNQDLIRAYCCKNVTDPNRFMCDLNCLKDKKELSQCINSKKTKNFQD